MLFVLDCRERIGGGDRFIAQRVFGLGVPVVIALNKVDRLKPGHIATQMQTAAALGDFRALHPISAKTGDGIDELRDELVELLPEGPLYFPPDVRTDVARGRPDRRARPREGARADPGRAAARDQRRGRGDRREHGARGHLRRDRLAEADRDRSCGRRGARDRRARAARGRGAARPPRLSSSCASSRARGGAATRRCSSASASSSLGTRGGVWLAVWARAASYATMNT